MRGGGGGGLGYTTTTTTSQTNHCSAMGVREARPGPGKVFASTFCWSARLRRLYLVGRQCVFRPWAPTCKGRKLDFDVTQSGPWGDDTVRVQSTQSREGRQTSKQRGCSAREGNQLWSLFPLYHPALSYWDSRCGAPQPGLPSSAGARLHRALYTQPDASMQAFPMPRLDKYFSPFSLHFYV